MKRLLTNYVTALCCGLLLLGAVPASASHYMGGNITYSCVGPNTFAFTAQLYRDCNGAAMPTSITLPIVSASCGLTTSIILELVQPGPTQTPNPAIITPLCPGELDACNSANGVYGIERYTYAYVPNGTGGSQASVTLPASCTDWVISWDGCCRNTTITTGPANNSIQIESLISNAGAPCNNSPLFLNDPTPYSCIGENVNYSHGVTEFDGDSLVFSLIPCKQTGGGSVTYNAGFSGTSPVASLTGVSINSQTGAINFTPSIAQVAVICVLVEEYRNGVKIGHVTRDIQFTVLNCTNPLPLASGANGTAGAGGATGDYNLSVCEGDTIDFMIQGFDQLGGGQATGNLIDMSWNGAINNGNASFTVFNNNTTTPSARFRWVTTRNDDGFYVFTVNLQDNACPINGVNIFTFSINVRDIPTVDAGAYQISCNAGDTVTISGVANALDSLFEWSAPLGGTILSPNALSTGVVPIPAGAYQLIKTYKYGCIDSNLVAVDVSQGITMPIIPDADICLGDSTTLDATVTVTPDPPTTFTNNTVTAFGTVADTTYLPISVTGIQPGIFTPAMLQSVCVDITYPFVSFLSLSLISPNGTIIDLSSNNGGGGANYTNTCFSPTATQSITAGTAPFNGSYLPEQSFNNLNGDVINGTWQLRVITGLAIPILNTINSWNITFLDITNTVSYNWTPAATLSCNTCPAPVATPTVPTTYFVTATDYFGCTDTQSVFIDIISALIAPTVTCCQVSTTALTFCWSDIAGAVGYEVSINNGTTWLPANGVLQHQLTGLALGQSVTILVRGISNCPGVAPTGTQTCTTTPCTLDGVLSASTNVTCNGGTNGTITVTATGGTAPYSFQAATTLPQQATGNFTGLAAGAYNVSVTDVNGCLDTVTVTLTEPTAVTFTTTFTATSCNGGNDGTASITATGGTGTYTYLWSASANNQTTATATNLAAGTYTFTVSTQQNAASPVCTANGSVTVTQPTALALTSSVTNVSCNGAGDGTATVSATGGTGGYTYLWSASANNQTTATATALNGGTHTVTVTDANGCTATTSVTINEATAIVLTTSTTQATCNGFSDGSATVSAIGGTGGYTYLWSASANNQTTATATNINTGLHNVTVTDAAGCTATTSVTVTAPASVTTTVTSVPSTSCSYSTDGSATVSAAGGAGGYTYQWSAGSNPTNASVLGLSTGVTYVTVTDANGCNAVDSVSINGPLPVIANPTATPISCNGANDGIITLAPTGGTGTLSFAWSNGAITQNLNGLAAGNYTVTITDANNCIFNASATIIEPNAISTTASMTAVSCFGGNNGTMTALPLGGQGGYTYLWSNSSADSIATSLTAGTYTLTITDVAGCTANTTIIVTQPTTVVSSTISGTNLLCNGDASGTATVVASGGTVGSGYTYLWSASANNQTTATATGLAAGTHTVTVTDGNGCTTTNTVTLTEPTVLGGTIANTPASCFGIADGTATVTPSGGTVGTGYTYLWSTSANNQTTATATNLAAGTHSVTVTDANNCTFSISTQVAQPNAITTTTTADSVSCNGTATGSGSVLAAGGNGGFTYAWSFGGVATASINNLPIGTYYVTVTDINNCTATDSILILEPTPLSSSTTSVNVLCNAAATGTATVAATGGTLSYTYLWNNNQTTATAINLAAGNYSVTVTDANGCTSTSLAAITEPATAVSATTTATNLLCNGDASGTATALPSGGTVGAGYTFLWSASANNQTTATATGLAAGSYTVTVTDGNGCTTTATATVTQPLALSGVTSETAASCFGATDGTASIVMSGGTPNYSYAWSSASSSAATASNLAAGTQYITVTDGNGCIYLDSFLIAQPTPILTTVTTVPVFCAGGATGGATVTVSGGNGSPTFLWSFNNLTTATVTGLPTGWHYVTVTDQNGCTTNDSAFIAEPNPLVLNTTQNNVSCFGQNNGNTTVTATGGTAPYTYAWSNGQTLPTANNLLAGTYTAAVTDANGCAATISVTITQPATAVTINNIAATQVNCFGGSDATATAQVTGGSGGYTYNWNGLGQTGQTATGLSIGTYTVIVTDINGCFAIDSVVIQQPAPITTIFTNITGSSCHQGNDGAATISASGGVPNGANGYTYVWNTIPQQQGATAVGLRGGRTYSVVITDANGCTTNNQVTIPQPDPVTLVTTQSNVSCFGFSDASASVIPSGGTPGFTFQWDTKANGQTTPTATNLAAGNYAVTVTDFFGCSAVIGVVITQPSPLVTNNTTTDVTCKGENTGTATVLMAGGTAPYVIHWSNGLIDPPTDLAAGTYAYTVTDANGCELFDQVTINEPIEGLTATFETVDATCFGDRDGSVSIAASGGKTPYKYSLDGNSYSNSPVRVGLRAGDYTFYVLDDNGCAFNQTFTITEPDEFTVSLGMDRDILYGETVDLEVETTNGVPEFSYVWSSTNNLSCTDCGNPTVDSLQDDAYYAITVTDERGCTATDDVSIRVTKPRYVFVANAFTPNGDGNNDVLFVQGGDGTLSVRTFRVFDRWGELIYEAADAPLNDTNFGWDGRYKDSELNGGVFVWFTEVEFEDGKVLTYKGSTVLIR